MFETEFLARLVGQIPDEDLEAVRSALYITLADYDVVKKPTKIVPYENPIPDAVKYYIASRHVEGLSRKTLERYISALHMFFQIVRKPLDEIKTNDIRAYLYGLQASGQQCNATLDGTRAVLNVFFSWCVDEGYIERNPVRPIKPIKPEKKERRYLTDAELERIRDACTDPTESAMIEFLYSTGCRVGELVALKKSDVDFATHEVKLFGKGSKHRTSYMNAKCEHTLRKYLLSRIDESDYLFVGKRRPHNPYTNRGVEKLIAKVGTRANLSFTLVPHILRHTTATHALQHGMDITEIQKLLGHSKLDTTMIYAKTAEDSVKVDHKKYVV